MKAKKYTPEQIIDKLREAQVCLSKGMTVPVVCKQLGIHEQTYYKWRKSYGGMRTDQAKKLKELEKENAQLKKLVAEFGDVHPKGTHLKTKCASKMDPP